MRVTHLNLPKDHIGLTKMQGLPLKIGDLLPATVLKTGPEYALLLIKGKQVLAEVKIPLQPGDELKVRVAGEFQNKIILKVLSELGTANPSPVEQWLRQAGGKSDADARSALTFLLRNGLPVTSDTLRAMVRDQQKPLDQILNKLFTETPPPEKQENTAQPIRSSSGEATGSKPAVLPESREVQRLGTPTSQRQGISPFPDRAGATLSTETPLPGDTIEQSLTQTPRSHPSSGTPNDPSPIANHGPNQPSDPVPLQDSHLNGGPRTEAPGPRTPNPTSRPLQDRLPIPGEPRFADATARPENDLHRSRPVRGHGDIEIAARLSEGMPELGEPIEGKDGKPRFPGTFARSNGESVRSLHESRGGIQGRIHDAPSGQIANTTPPAKAYTTPTSTGERLVQLGLALNPERNPADLIAGLKELARHLGLAVTKNPESEINEENLASHLPTPLGDEQKEGLHELAEKLLGMRLHQQENHLLMHMEIPLYLLGQLTTARLQIREDEHQQAEAGKKPLSILFNLHTDLLGHLKVMVLLEEQEIMCQFSSDRETTRMLLRQFLPDLKERFEAISYQVNHMSVLPLIEDEPEEKIEPLPGQVDFRV